MHIGVMNNLKATEKLDTVLNYFQNHGDRDISIRELSEYLQLVHPGIFTDTEINWIINNLLKDRHIIVTIPKFYKITLEGTLFFENGGYTIQRKSDYIKRQYLKIAHRSGNQSTNLILWVLAMTGMLVAYLILKYGYDHFNWKLPF
jgi:hypothetical protein